MPNPIDVNKLVPQKLNSSDIEQLVELFIASYSLSDPFVKSGLYTGEKLRKYFDDRIHKFLQAQKLYNTQNKTNITFNHVYKHNGNIIASHFSIYLPLYFKYFANEQEVQILNKIDWTKQPKGLSVYGSGFCVHKDYMQHGIGGKLLSDAFTYILSKGFKYAYGVSVNKLSIGMSLKVGGQIIYEEDYKKQDLSIHQTVLRKDLEKIYRIISKL